MLQSKVSIGKYITSLFVDLATNIQTLHQDISPKNTRIVRTYIKQIRACVDFAIYMNKEYKGEDISYILDLYSIIGTSRARQISDKRLAPFVDELGEKQTTAYIAYAHKQQKKADKQLTKLLQQETPSLQTIQEHLQQTFFSTSKKDLTIYRLTYQETTESRAKRILRKKNIKDEDVHTLRKAYKKILYLGNILLTHHQRVTQTYDLLQKQMGRWNDTLDLIEHLHTYEKKHHSQKVKQLISGLKKITKKEKKDIIAQLHLMYTDTPPQKQ